MTNYRPATGEKTMNRNYYTHRSRTKTGDKFGRWTVIETTRIKNRSSEGFKNLALCKCECGSLLIVDIGNLRAGKSLSCGCLARELAHSRNVIHGMKCNNKQSRLYTTYHRMLSRTTNPKERSYKYYGGRGISVCQEWRDSFMCFAQWANTHGYTEELQIDRIDNDGNYCPENCRFVTAQENQNNKTSNRLLTHNGETHTVADWARLIGMKYRTLQYRILLGWSVERALTEKLNHAK